MLFGIKRILFDYADAQKQQGNYDMGVFGNSDTILFPIYGLVRNVLPLYPSVYVPFNTCKNDI